LDSAAVERKEDADERVERKHMKEKYSLFPLEK